MTRGGGGVAIVAVWQCHSQVEYIAKWIKKKERNDHMEVDSHSRKGLLKDYDLFTIFIDFKWNLLLCSGSLMVE